MCIRDSGDVALPDDFLRAVSIILVVMNVYWFCYEAIRLWGVNIRVVDKILLNFDRTAGLFHSILYTKLFGDCHWN